MTESNNGLLSYCSPAGRGLANGEAGRSARKDGTKADPHTSNVGSPMMVVRLTLKG